MFDTYLFQGGKSATIQEYTNSKALKSTHFEDMKEE